MSVPRSTMGTWFAAGSSCAELCASQVCRCQNCCIDDCRGQPLDVCDSLPVPPRLLASLIHSNVKVLHSSGVNLTGITLA